MVEMKRGRRIERVGMDDDKLGGTVKFSALCPG